MKYNYSHWRYAFYRIDAGGAGGGRSCNSSTNTKNTAASKTNTSSTNKNTSSSNKQTLNENRQNAQNNKRTTTSSNRSTSSSNKQTLNESRQNVQNSKINTNPKPHSKINIKSNTTSKTNNNYNFGTALGGGNSFAKNTMSRSDGFNYLNSAKAKNINKGVTGTMLYSTRNETIRSTLDLNANKSKDTLGDKLVKTGATLVVASNSVISGITKISEKIEDGLTWAGGTIVSGFVSIFDKEASKRIQEEVMNTIAYDKVGNLNKTFYEGTKIGKAINDASYLKYDSDVSKKIQDVTAGAGEAIGVTVATIATGGAAGVALAGTVGFSSAAGSAAENKFQDKENRDYWKDSLSIGVDGAIGAVNDISIGRAGNAAYQGIKGLTKAGILKSGLNAIKNVPKNTINMFRDNGTKEAMKIIGNNIKNGLVNVVNFTKSNAGKVTKEALTTTLTDQDFLLESGGVLLDDVKSGIETGKWDIAKMFAQTGGVYISNFIGNLAGGLISTRILTTNEGKALGTNLTVKNNTVVEDANSAFKINSLLDQKDIKNPDDFFTMFNTEKGYYGADQDASRKYIKYKFLGTENASITAEDYVESFFKLCLEQDPNQIITEEIRRKNINAIKDRIEKGWQLEQPVSLDVAMRHFIDKNNGDFDAAFKEFNTNFVPVSNERVRQIEILTKKGMSKTDAVKTLSAINTDGVCTYAASANAILYAYRDHPDLFEKNFGFKMFTEIDGKKVLNTNELVIDMYTDINAHNDKLGNDRLFKIENGKLSVNNLNTSKQLRLNSDSYTSVDTYLKRKNAILSLTYDGAKIARDDVVGESKKYFETSLKEGDVLIMGIKDPKNLSALIESDKNVKNDGILKIFDSNGNLIADTGSWSEGEGHAVLVTGTTDKGLKISTWGTPGVITYENLNETYVTYTRLHIGGIE